MTPNNSESQTCINRNCIVKDVVVENVNSNESQSYIKNANQMEVLEHKDLVKRDAISQFLNLKTDLIWFNVIFMVVLNTLAIYNLLTFPYLIHLKSTLFIVVMTIIGWFGITGGCHRYWSHRSYKAKLPLRIILLLSHSSSGFYSILNWAKDHRVHHKYTDTDADPHNSRRGFFYSHIGWLVMKPHPECEKRHKEVDLSDVLADPVIIFGEKYFELLRLVFCYFLPTLIPMYFWNESCYYAIASQIFIRYSLVIHGICSINSVAHLWGSKPYNKNICPTDNLFIAIVSAGEGWHNYHHCFPWDYKAAELGSYSSNITTCIINMFAKIGWAYGFREAPPKLVKSFIMNKGDGSYRYKNY